jgi:ectoine hydroxylase-related dioxygenase (phytanoyl-CoA dioxygenase family)
VSFAAGSHKSEIAHPVQRMMQTEGSQVEGAVEMHMSAGDCLVFNDSILHGAAARLTAGERRVVCFRYLPSNYRYRWQYTASSELWARLTPSRRELLAAVAMQSGGAMGQQAYKL